MKLYIVCFLAAVVCASAQNQNAGFLQNLLNDLGKWREQGQNAFNQGQQQLQSAFEQGQQQLQSALGQGKQHAQRFGQTAQNGFNGALNHGRQFFNGLNPSANSNGKPSQ